MTGNIAYTQELSNTHLFALITASDISQGSQLHCWWARWH